MLLLIVPSCVFLNVRGMEDVPMWRDWARKVNELWRCERQYRVINMEVSRRLPPAFSGWPPRAGDKFNLTPIASIKFSLLIALLVTTGVVWFLTMDEFSYRPRC